MSVLCRWPILLLCLAPACADRPAAPPAPRAPDSEAGALFDPATAGTITGFVRWVGPVPTAEPFRSIDEPLTDKPPPPARDWPNPNVPRVHPETGGLAGAVVLLRGVDPRKARPWDHPAVRVELRGQAFHVRQGAHDGPVGFTRPGEPVDFVSRDDRLHVAQARGDAFFSLALPRPHAPRVRRFDAPGVVELTSGSGYFWMRAYLHVSDHPYLTRTDGAGHFRLDQVPAGEYELAVWHPDWRVSRTERNPDLFRVQQVRFGPPLQVSRRVAVRAGQVSEAKLSVSAAPTP